MNVTRLDYLIFFGASITSIISWYNQLPEITSLTVITGLIATTWLIIITYGPEWPDKPIRSLIDKLRKHNY